MIFFFFFLFQEQTWNHYANPPDYRVIDKQGVKQLAEDAVMSFVDCARAAVLHENPRWSEAKIEARIAALRSVYLPGSTLVDSIVIAASFLAHELKFSTDAAPDNSRNGSGSSSHPSSPSPPSVMGVTKPCFFLHFQRAHRLLFSYNASEKQPSLERELIVHKLNKQGVERANKGLKSLTSNRLSNQSLGLSSAKSANKSHRASKKASKKAKSKQNMFGELEFGSTEKK